MLQGAQRGIEDDHRDDDGHVGEVADGGGENRGNQQHHDHRVGDLLPEGAQHSPLGPRAQQVAPVGGQSAARLGLAQAAAGLELRTRAGRPIGCLPIEHACHPFVS